MVFLYVAEMLVVVLVFVFFLFQVIIPMWNDTLMFPSFRRSKPKEPEQQLPQAKSDLEPSQEELKGNSNGDEHEPPKSV